MAKSHISLFPMVPHARSASVQMSIVLKGTLGPQLAPDPDVAQAFFNMPSGERARWKAQPGNSVKYSTLVGDVETAANMMDTAQSVNSTSAQNAISELRADTLSQALAWAEWIRVQHPMMDLWFRGQRVKSWKLLPRLSRERALRERDILSHFRRGMASRTPRAAGLLSPLELMSLAQHYGAPTRLLDWTQSMTTALFFAVSSQARNGTEAAVTVMLPKRINTEQGKGTTLLTDQDQEVGLLASQTVRVGPSTSREVVAFLPTQIDERQRIQAGAFTVHATDQPLEAHPRAREALFKIVLSASGVRRVKADLDELFGVTRGYLFPDWQGLGEESAELGRAGLVNAAINIFTGHPFKLRRDPSWGAP